MKRFALIIAATLTSGVALAQNYQSALPVSPAERRAIEARLSTILDYAGTDEVSRFSLPTGRQVLVRTYRPVMRNGRQPCRGYRIDVAGPRGTTAVDGYRCRRARSQAWVIVEPEIVLAQNGAPLDLRNLTEAPPAQVAPPPGGGFGAPPQRIEQPGRFSDQLLYPDEPDPVAESTEPPPVPRPAPRTDIATGTTTGPADTSTFSAAPPAATDIPPLSNGTSGANGTSVATTSPAPIIPSTSGLDGVRRVLADGERPANVANAPAPAQAPAPTSTAAAPSASPGVSVVSPSSGNGGGAPVTTLSREQPARSNGPAQTARVVGERNEASDDAFSGNATIVNALKDLDYLPLEATVDEAGVQAAVDDFARDERFALPVSSDALIARLNDALDRSETLPTCTGGAAGPCVVPE
ncbi:hypothetical protein [Acuticoccus kandeliae]|uniref:hypothetical protein n=1 Tax=Acuticoccus kandeliae TaxID=2073160 RepID=UPI000D3EA48A|nr:hypothetical protein [Acuticoccus kandeliae]